MKYNKLVLVFPGQGSQYKGMGKALYDAHESVRHIFNQASQILDYDIASVCFREGPIRKGLKMIKLPLGKEHLDTTFYAQPAILTTSYACYKALEERCADKNVELNPYLMMGHSFGEYTALIAADAMNFETALNLVQRRAELMTESIQSNPNTGLMAVMPRRGQSLEDTEMKSLCGDFEVYVALINTDNQVVVGGNKRKLEGMSKYLKGQGMRGLIIKGAEGAFHTPLMERVAEKFKKDLDKAEIYVSSRSIIANVTAEAISDPEHIREELRRQIYKEVDWRASVRKAIDSGTELFIEVGPGTKLSDMIGIIEGTKTLNVENMESLEKTVEMLRDVKPPEETEKPSYPE